MTANKLIRNPLWATLLAALVAAMVSYFVFVPNSEAAPAADGKYSPYIINGKPVPNGKYPFVAALINTKPKNPYPFCGGTLIDKTHVLTAGHCVFQRGPKASPPQKPQDTLVFVGRTVLSSNQGQVRNVKDIDVHPLFKAAKYAGTIDFRYDAAVLTLSRAVKGIKPIELASSSQNNLERPDRDATAAGWGATNARTPCENPKPVTANRMQEAQLPIVSDSRADKIFQQPPACAPQASAGKDFPDFVPRLMIAAGGKDAGSCKGDSGGPLFVRTSGNDDNNGRNGDDENGGKYTQIGINSWGLGCGVARSPSVFSEVNAKPIASFIERAADNGDGDDDNGDDNGDDK